MARIISDDEPARKPVQDPLSRADIAISRLATVVEHMAEQMRRPAPVVAAAPRIDFPPPEPRPVRLEGEVARDAKGRMTRIIITPIYY